MDGKMMSKGALPFGLTNELVIILAVIAIGLMITFTLSEDARNALNILLSVFR